MNYNIVNGQPAGNIFRVGKVVATHPEGHSVDVVLLDDGTRLSDVQMLSSGAGTRTGRVNLPRPAPAPDGDKWSMAMSGTQDVLAVVVMTHYRPFCLGTFFPQVNQLAMPDDDEELQDLMIDRHTSDFVTTTTKDACHSLHHPSGAYLTIGGTEPPDLEGRDCDGKWRIENNTEDEKSLLYAVAKELHFGAAGEGKVETERVVIGCGTLEVQAGRITFKADRIDLN